MDNFNYQAYLKSGKIYGGKQEVISELDYRQSISNDRFAALENTQSSAKSIDQVEMDNIWDQLEIVNKKVYIF